MWRAQTAAPGEGCPGSKCTAGPALGSLAGRCCGRSAACSCWHWRGCTEKSRSEHWGGPPAATWHLRSAASATVLPAARFFWNILLSCWPPVITAALEDPLPLQVMVHSTASEIAVFSVDAFIVCQHLHAGCALLQTCCPGQCCPWGFCDSCTGSPAEERFAFRSEPDSPTSGPSSPSTPAHFSLRSPAMTAFADSGTSTPDGEDQLAQVQACADCSCQRPTCEAVIVACSKTREAVPIPGQPKGHC